MSEPTKIDLDPDTRQFLDGLLLTNLFQHANRPKPWLWDAGFELTLIKAVAKDFVPRFRTILAESACLRREVAELAAEINNLREALVASTRKRQDAETRVADVLKLHDERVAELEKTEEDLATARRTIDLLRENNREMGNRIEEIEAECDDRVAEDAAEIERLKKQLEQKQSAVADSFHGVLDTYFPGWRKVQ